MQLNDANPAKNIPIGIICPLELQIKMSEQLRGFPSFSPIFITFRHENEIAGLITAIMGDVEVLLFSCPHSYRHAYEQIRFTVPAHYVPLTGSGVYRALFRVAAAYGLQSLAIDTITEQSVSHAFRELGIDEPDIHYYSDSPYPSSEDLVAFHRKQYDERKSIAMTGAKSVADQLVELDIPHQWVIPTDHDIIVSLERALLSTESRKLKESQIVVGLILVHNFAKLEEQQRSEHELQRLKLDLHRVLLDYAESMQGYLTPLDGSQFLFVTTRGVFERETRGYKSIPLGKEIQHFTGLTMSIGIGFGPSASEAGNHARTALRHAASAGGNQCFIVREDEGLIGPLEMGEPLEYNLSLIHPDILRKAEQCGLNALYLGKLSARISKMGKLDYVAHELAFIFGITTRSVHRMLLKLSDAELVDIAGYTANPRGRPKQIYRMHFLEHIVKRK